MNAKSSVFLLLSLCLTAFVLSNAEEFDDGVTVEDESVSCAKTVAAKKLKTFSP